MRETRCGTSKPSNHDYKILPVKYVLKINRLDHLQLPTLVGTIYVNHKCIHTTPMGEPIISKLCNHKVYEYR